MRPEAKFQNELKSSFVYLYGPNIFWYKLPDRPFDESHNLPEHLRFIPKSPFDIFATIGGISFAFELKVISGTVIPFSKLTESTESITERKGKQITIKKWGQLENLLHFNKCGGKSFVVVRMNGESSNTCCFISILQWITFKEFLFHNSKSIDLLMIPNESIILRQKVKTKTVWNVSKLIDNYLPEQCKILANQTKLGLIGD